MLSHRILFVSVFAMLTTVACGNASFFGGSKKKTVTAPAPNTTPTNSPVPANGTNTAENPATKIPAGQNPNVQNPNGQVPQSVIYPVPGQNGQNGQYPNQQNPYGQYGNCDEPNCQYQSVPQIPNQGQINVPCTGSRCQQPGQMSNNQVVNQGPNTVTFGTGQALIIGATTTAQYFRFEVLTDNTVVTVSANGLSGIEQSTNVLEVYSAVERVHVQILPVNQASFNSSSVTLKKGIYSVVLATTGSNRDQFNVGTLIISGNQALRGLQSAAYNR